MTISDEKSASFTIFAQNIDCVYTLKLRRFLQVPTVCVLEQKSEKNVYHFITILSQTPNSTRNEAQFNRSKFSRKTKLTKFSQQQSINILKPLILSADKGSLSCVLIGQNQFPFFLCFLKNFLKFTKVCFAFCHSVTSFHFVKQCRVKKYGLSLFLFKTELGFIEINVSQTRNPIPMLNQYR